MADPGTPVDANPPKTMEDVLRAYEGTTTPVEADTSDTPVDAPKSMEDVLRAHTQGNAPVKPETEELPEPPAAGQGDADYAKFVEEFEKSRRVDTEELDLPGLFESLSVSPNSVDAETIDSHARALGYEPDEFRKHASNKGVNLSYQAKRIRKGAKPTEVAEGLKRLGTDLTPVKRPETEEYDSEGAADPELAKEFRLSKERAGFGGSDDEFRELTDAGKAVAKAIMDDVRADGRAITKMNIYGDHEQGFRAYTLWRTQDLMERSGIDITDDNFNEAEMAAIKQAMKEMAAAKMEGTWTAPIFLPASLNPNHVPGFWDAAKPTVEVIGMNADNQIILRQEGAAQWAFDMADMPQAGLAGIIMDYVDAEKHGEDYDWDIGKSAVSGFANRRHALEVAKEIAPSDPYYMATALGFAVAVAFPDMFEGVGPLMRASKKLSRELKLAGGIGAEARAIDLLEEIATAGYSSNYEKIQDAETALRKEFPQLADELDIGDSNLAAHAVETYPEIADVPYATSLPGITGENAHILHPAWQAKWASRTSDRGTTRGTKNYDALYNTGARLADVATSRKSIGDMVDPVKRASKLDSTYAKRIAKSRKAFAAVDKKSTSGLFTRLEQATHRAIENPSQWEDDMHALISKRYKKFKGDDHIEMRRDLHHTVRDMAYEAKRMNAKADVSRLDRAEKLIKVNREMRTAAAAALRDSIRGVSPENGLFKQIWGTTAEDTKTPWLRKAFRALGRPPADIEVDVFKGVSDTLAKAGINIDPADLRRQYKADGYIDVEKLGHKVRKLGRGELSDEGEALVTSFKTHFNMSEKEARATATVVDAHASYWANREGRSVSEWYATRIAEVRKGLPANVDDILYEAGDPAPVFYSALAARADKLPNKVGLDGLIPFLRKGVKAEEIEWVEVQGLIDEARAAGKKSLTREEVSTWLKAHAIEPVDIVRGSTPAELHPDVQANLTRTITLPGLTPAEVHRVRSMILDGDYVRSHAEQEATLVYTELQAIYKLEIKAGTWEDPGYAAVRFADEAGHDYAHLTPKDAVINAAYATEIKLSRSGVQLAEEAVTRIRAWNKLAEPDAETLDLWEEIGSVSAPEAARWAEYTLEGGENYRELLIQLPAGVAKGTVYDLVDEVGRPVQSFNSRAAADSYLDSLHHAVGPGDNPPTGYAVKESRDAIPGYHGDHWNEPNVLVHVRMTDRVLPDGRKALHIEEIQSDWHQDARKTGYAGTPSRAAALEAAELKRVEAEAAIDEWVEGIRVFEAYPGRHMMTDAAGRPIFRGIEEMDNGKFRVIHSDVKRVYSTLDEAMVVVRRDAKVHKVPIELTGPLRTAHRAIYDSAQDVPNAPFKKTWADLALKRILRQAVDEGYDVVTLNKGEVIAGIVGGDVKGQKEFYDKILTRKMKKLTGQKVEEGKVPTGPNIAYDGLLDARNRLQHQASGTGDEKHLDLILEKLEDVEASIVMMEKAGDNLVTEGVHLLELTDDVKAEVGKPQPLFSRPHGDKPLTLDDIKQGIANTVARVAKEGADAITRRAEIGARKREIGGPIARKLEKQGVYAPSEYRKASRENPEYTALEAESRELSGPAMFGKLNAKSRAKRETRNLKNPVRQSDREWRLVVEAKADDTALAAGLLVKELSPEQATRLKNFIESPDIFSPALMPDDGIDAFKIGLQLDTPEAVIAWEKFEASLRATRVDALEVNKLSKAVSEGPPRSLDSKSYYNETVVSPYAWSSSLRAEGLRVPRQGVEAAANRLADSAYDKLDSLDRKLGDMFGDETTIDPDTLYSRPAFGLVRGGKSVRRDVRNEALASYEVLGSKSEDVAFIIEQLLDDAYAGHTIAEMLNPKLTHEAKLSRYGKLISSWGDMVEDPVVKRAVAFAILNNGLIKGDKLGKNLSHGNIALLKRLIPDLPVKDQKLITAASDSFWQKAGKKGKAMDAKAAVIFQKDGSSIIAALKSPDISSALHEFAHVFRRDLLPHQMQQVRHWLVNNVETWEGVKFSRTESGPGSRIVSLDVDGGKFVGSAAQVRAAEEAFARAFERHLRDGRSEVPILQAVFEDLKKWLKKIYAKVTGSEIDIEISEKMRNLFDDIVTPVDVKTRYDVNELGDLQRKLEADQIALRGEQGHKPQVHGETSGSESSKLTQRISQELTYAHGEVIPDTPLSTKGRRAAAQMNQQIDRAVMTTMFGGDPDKLLRQFPEEARLRIKAGPRLVRQSYSDAVRLVSERDPVKVAKYLGGEAVTLRRGEQVVSSGSDLVGPVAGQLRRWFNSMTDKHKRALIKVAERLNEPGEWHVRGIPGYANAMDSFLVGGKNMPRFLQASMQALAAHGLSARHGVAEARALEAMLYVAGVTKRNGSTFVGKGAERATILLNGIEEGFGPQASAKIAVLAAGHGQVTNVHKMWSGMGLFLDEGLMDAYRAFVSAEAVEPRYVDQVRKIVRRLGLHADFADPETWDMYRKMYLPEAARDALATALEHPVRTLGKAHDKLESEGTADKLLRMALRFWKNKVTRGAWSVRQTYYTMNTFDNFSQLGMSAGFAPSFMNFPRVAVQNFSALPGFGLAMYGMEAAANVGRRGKPRVNVTESVRHWLQGIGDKGSHVVGRMVSDSKWHIGVNDVLEGRQLWKGEKSFTFNNRVYTPQQVRDVFVQEGVFSSFDVTALKSVVARTATMDAKKFLDEGRSVGNVLEDMLGATTSWSSDIAEAWSMRERVGTAITLMELGLDPRTAARLTVESLYDYGGSMSAFDRSWVMQIVFPFWAYQKNANRQVMDSIFDWKAAYRMGVIRRAQHLGPEALSQIVYSGAVDDYGIAEEQLGEDSRALYYSLRTEIEKVYGNPDDVPFDVKVAIRAIMSSTRKPVIKGNVYELGDNLRPGITGPIGGGYVKDAGEQAAAYPGLVEPAHLPHYYRDRAHITITPQRKEMTAKWFERKSPSSPSLSLILPDSTIDAGMSHVTNTAATMLLGINELSRATLGVAPGGGDREGASFTRIVEPLSQVTDLSRAPGVSYVASIYDMNTMPPARIHPSLAALMFDGVDIKSYPAVSDPWSGGDDIDISGERTYIRNGTQSLIFKMSPLSGLNDLLLAYERTPLEDVAAQEDLRVEMLRWARVSAGLKTVETDADSAATRAETWFMRPTTVPQD